MKLFLRQKSGIIKPEPDRGTIENNHLDSKKILLIMISGLILIGPTMSNSASVVFASTELPDGEGDGEGDGDNNNGQQQVDDNNPECPSGQRYDEETEECVDDTVQPPECPSGQRYDEETEECVEDVSILSVEANDDTATTQAGTEVVINVLDNDGPDQENLMVANVNDPVRGAAIIGPDGKTITYTPDSGSNDNFTDTFTYSASDSNGITDTATVTVTIVSFTNPPNSNLATAELGIQQAGITANAGEDRTIRSGETTLLDGSGSLPPKNITYYKWKQIEDGGVSPSPGCDLYQYAGKFNTVDQRRASFTAPILPNGIRCTFGFELEVSDGKILDPVTDQVDVTVEANNATNQPPVAIAKAGGEVASDFLYNMGHQAVRVLGNDPEEDRSVELDGTGSFDPDGGNITDYAWNLDKVIVYSWKHPETGQYEDNSWILDPCQSIDPDNPDAPTDTSDALRWNDSDRSIKWCHPHRLYQPYRAEEISQSLDGDPNRAIIPDFPYPNDTLGTYIFTLTVTDDEGMVGSDEIMLYLDPFDPDTTIFTITARSPTQPTNGGSPGSGGGGGGSPGSGGGTTQPTEPPYSGLRDIEDPNNSAIPASPETSSASPASQNDFLVYQNNTFAVKIEYPSSWSKAERDTNSLDPFSEIVSFHSPLQNSSDTYSEKVLLKVLDLGGQNRSLDNYLYDTINYHIANSTDFKIIQADTNATFANTTFAAKPAYKLIYNHMILQNNTTLQTMEIGTIIGNKLYAISFNAEPGSYPSYYSEYVQRMLSSFEITNNNINSR